MKSELRSFKANDASELGKGAGAPRALHLPSSSALRLVLPAGHLQQNPQNLKGQGAWGLGELGRQGCLCGEGQRCGGLGPGGLYP